MVAEAPLCIAGLSVFSKIVDLLQDRGTGAGEQDEPIQPGDSVWAHADAASAHRCHRVPVLAGGLSPPGTRRRGSHRVL